MNSRILSEERDLGAAQLADDIRPKIIDLKTTVRGLINSGWWSAYDVEEKFTEIINMLEKEINE